MSQRQLTEQPCHRSRNGKTDEDIQRIAPAQHIHNLACRCTHCLADAEFLTAVLGLKHRQAEDSNQRDNQADDTDHHHQVHITEFAAISFS